MSSGRQPTDRPPRVDEAAPSVKGEQPRLFSTLLATRPPEPRRLGPWAIAALLHLIILGPLLWLTEAGRSLRESVVEIVTPVLLQDDNPPPLPQPIIDLPRERVPAQPRTQPATTTDREREAPVRPVTDAPLLPPRGEAAAAAAASGAGQPSLAERLGRGAGGDPRLFAPVGPAAPLVGPDAARARLAERLAQINDSIAAERGAAARARDWTYTDKNGRRWGAADGKIYIAGVAAPFTVEFRPPPGRRDEVKAQLESWHAIEAQAARAEIKDSFEERVKEIRARKEKERAKKKPVTDGS